MSTLIPCALEQAVQGQTLIQAGFAPELDRFRKEVGDATIFLFPLASGLWHAEIYRAYNQNGKKFFHLTDTFGEVLTLSLLSATLSQDPDSFDSIRGEF